MSEFDVALGGRVRGRRKECNLTPPQLAKAINCSLAQMYRYESGDTKLDPETLARVAWALKCRVGDLVDEIAVQK